MVNVNTLSRKIGGGLVGLCLTRKMRRMIFVAGTATFLHALNKEGPLQLHQLNKVAKLAYSDSGLEFPATLGDTIWKDSGLTEEDLHADRESLIAKLLSLVPPYLHYGNGDAEMRVDAQTIITCSITVVA